MPTKPAGSRKIIDESAPSGQVWAKPTGRPMQAQKAMGLLQALDDREPSDLSAVEKHRLRKHIRPSSPHGDLKNQLQSWLSARAAKVHVEVAADGGAAGSDDLSDVGWFQSLGSQVTGPPDVGPVLLYVSLGDKWPAAVVGACE